MATAAERKRRSRAHQAGDHSLCDSANAAKCAEVDASRVTADVTPSRAPKRVTPVAPVSAPPVVVDQADNDIETEVQEFVDTLLKNFPEGDPRRILCRIAVKLARRVDETGAAPAAIQQLRVLLMQIAEVPEQAAGPLDGTRARRAVRRLDQLLGRVG